MTRVTYSVALVLATLGWFAVPATTHAHDPLYPKLDVHFRLGFAGEMERPNGQFIGMDPSFGGGLELEVPVNTHFSLGGAVEAYGWTVASTASDYNVGLDFLFMPRFRVPFGDHPWHAEVYFGLPIGPHLTVPSDRFAQTVTGAARSAGFGVTGGGLVGVRWNANDHFGAYIDLGPRFQWMSLPSRGGGADFEFWQYQFVLRVGGSFGFAHY
jgi:hypothetical protein